MISFAGGKLKIPKPSLRDNIFSLLTAQILLLNYLAAIVAAFLSPQGLAQADPAASGYNR